jgi:hypothetical protein
MTKATIPPRKLYPVSECRELLGGIGKTFFYEVLVKQNELDLIKLGRRSYVTAESIDKLIQRRSASRGR